MDYVLFIIAKSIRYHREGVMNLFTNIINFYDDILWRLEFKVEPHGHDFE